MIPKMVKEKRTLLSMECRQCDMGGLHGDRSKESMSATLESTVMNSRLMIKKITKGQINNSKATWLIQSAGSNSVIPAVKLTYEEIGRKIGRKKLLLQL